MKLQQKMKKKNKIDYDRDNVHIEEVIRDLKNYKKQT